MTNTPFLDITRHLELMVAKNASDMFFTVGSPVRVKIEGQLMTAGKTILTTETMDDAAKRIMNEEQRQELERYLQADFAISLPDNAQARFRINAFKQRQNIAMVVRYIRPNIPFIVDLGLPEILKDKILSKSGLILVAGTTGSGKSTTIAAMLDFRNEVNAGHILTVEDPVEFIYTHKKSVVNQRELGIDTHSYADALKGAMREAPDVVLVGEARDRDTMQAVLELSSTGQLAISTVHARNTYQAIQRVITMFPPARHEELFIDLSMNLVCVVSQRLIKSRTGKRVPAIEIMVNTPFVSDLILNGKLTEIKEAMKNSNAKGMQTFEDSLLDLYQKGQIDLTEALENADSRIDLETRINFGE
ncbi:MAG: PilT/PilU family type 4a pilus ATPase [Pseudomonadota bacterium]